MGALAPKHRVSSGALTDEGGGVRGERSEVANFLGLFRILSRYHTAHFSHMERCFNICLLDPHTWAPPDQQHRSEGIVVQFMNNLWTSRVRNHGFYYFNEANSGWEGFYIKILFLLVHLLSRWTVTLISEERCWERGLRVFEPWRLEEGAGCTVSTR